MAPDAWWTPTGRYDLVSRAAPSDGAPGRPSPAGPLGGPESGDFMRTLLAIPILVMAVPGCGPEADLAEQRVRQLMQIWETGDASRLAEIASPELVYDDIPNGQRYEGLDGAQRYVGHVHSWASQVTIAVTAVHGGPDGAVAEWVMRGFQDRPIAGRVPAGTNRPFELNGATVVEVRDGRIIRAADYLDVLGFVLQLGAQVELPGGVVIPTPAAAAQLGHEVAGTPGRR